MRFTKILTLLIVFSVVAFGGWGDVQASTDSETISESQISSHTGVLGFFHNLLFGSARETVTEQQTYNSTATGKQVTVAPGVNSPLTITLNLSGSLPGSFVSTIEYNSSNAITSGNWQQIITEINSNGESVEVGTLSGRFTGGTVSLNSDGSIASVNSAQIIVESGAGNYANISSGSGMLQGSFDNSNTPASFSGTEILNF